MRLSTLVCHAGTTDGCATSSHHSQRTRAIRADEELPERVHLEYHGGLLRDLGLDPAVLQWELGQASRRFEHNRFGRGRPARRSLAGRS